jgi:hypothetical protein
MTFHRLAWPLFFFLSSSPPLRPLSGDEDAKRFDGVVEVAAVVGGGVIDPFMNNSDAVPWRVPWLLLLLFLLGPSSCLPKKLGRCAVDGPHEFDGTFRNERNADDDL